jgi:hypothetical protein
MSERMIIKQPLKNKHLPLVCERFAIKEFLKMISLFFSAVGMRKSLCYSECTG